MDRVEPSDALEVVRILKTFLDEKRLDGKRLVLIVPCDESQLADHIKKELYVEDAHEFLRKFFNISILVPELVHENIVSYARDEFEKVLCGLRPSISKENAEKVSFIISRAARRSPRQVKVLVNAFVAFWQGAGLVGVAGTDISPLGVAIFVCLQYLLKNSEMPSLQNLQEKEFPESKDDHVKNFIDSISPFLYEISGIEWLSLRRLQLSDDEKKIPDFIDIYYSIVDNNWEEVDELFPTSGDLKDLIYRIDKKAREGGEVAYDRFTSWGLSLLAEEKLSSVDLPGTLRQYIQYRIEMYWMTSISKLFDVGLAEFIFQEKISPKAVVGCLRELQTSIKQKKPPESMFRFISSFITHTKSEYWLDKDYHDDLAKALDEVVFNAISNIKLSMVMLENLHVLVFDKTGVALAEKITSQSEIINKTEEDVFRSMFDNIDQTRDGPYSFAAQWVRTGAISAQDVSIRLTLSCIEALFDAPSISALVKERLSHEGHLNQLISKIQTDCANGVRQGEFKEAFYGAITLSVIAIWAEMKLGMTAVATSAKSSSSAHVWPQIVDKFGELVEKDQNTVIGYFDKYPKFLAHIQHGNLATLSQHETLQILSRLIDTQNLTHLENVISSLISQNQLGDAIKPWLKKISKLPVKQSDADVELEILFRVFVQQNPPSSIYSDLAEALRPLQRRKITKTVVRKHMKWLLDVTNWANQGSIELTVEKMKTLEIVVLMDEEITDLLRGKVSADGRLDLMESVLSDSARAWITDRLKGNNK